MADAKERAQLAPEADHAPDARPVPGEEDVLAAVRRAVNGELGIAREVRLADDLVTDLQLDSMGLLTLVVELENTFRIALREEDSASVRTVRDLVTLVVARIRGAP
ncbi:MAG: hypothetical protein NVSMB23_18880 [Myxococcales bacterium]